MAGILGNIFGQRKTAQAQKPYWQQKQPYPDTNAMGGGYEQPATRSTFNRFGPGSPAGPAYQALPNAPIDTGNSPAQVRLLGTAIGPAAQTYGPGMANRMYSDPELASITSPGTYQQMQAANQRMGASTSLLNRNTAALSGVGQPNPSGAMADGVLGGQRLTGASPSDSGWMMGGRTYGGVGREEAMPDPNQVQVQPQYGQTAAEAQQAYLGQQAEAARQMGQRVGSMQDRGLLGPGPNMAYTAPSTGSTLSVTPKVMGGTGNVGLRVQGTSPPIERWNGMTSSLPGAEGRTNGEMATIARQNRRESEVARRDNRAINRGLLSGRRNLSSMPALAAAAERQGVLLPGQRRTQPGGDGLDANGAVATNGPAAARSLTEAATTDRWQFLGVDPTTAEPTQILDSIAQASLDGQLDQQTMMQLQADIQNRIKADPKFFSNKGVLGSAFGIAEVPNARKRFDLFLKSKSPEQFAKDLYSR